MAPKWPFSPQLVSYMFPSEYLLAPDGSVQLTPRNAVLGHGGYIPSATSDIYGVTCKTRETGSKWGPNGPPNGLFRPPIPQCTQVPGTYCTHLFSPVGAAGGAAPPAVPQALPQPVCTFEQVPSNTGFRATVTKHPFWASAPLRPCSAATTC
jgi:hypothetical protein